MPLRSAEISIDVDAPRTPDVHIGHVFDHNWELLGFLVPMWLFRAVVQRHLRGRVVPFEVFKNVSRLTTQWENSVATALTSLEKQAEQQVDELVATLDRLLIKAGPEAPQIRADLARITSMLRAADRASAGGPAA